MGVTFHRNEMTIGEVPVVLCEANGETQMRQEEKCMVGAFMTCLCHIA